jgi:Ca2+-binding EF-hand superfamily protein
MNMSNYSNNNMNMNNNFQNSFNNRDPSPVVQKLSPNLSLRLSPERKYSPRQSPRTSPLRENNYIIHSQTTNCSPNRQNRFNNNINNRQFSQINSPHRHSPRFSHRCSPKHSPLRPCQNNSNCNKCFCFPCKCCQRQYNKAECGFLDYVQEIMDIEDQIEKAKIDLALRSDFNAVDCFKIFELNGRGIITPQDLKYGLDCLEIFTSQNDIKLIMRRADLKKCGGIIFLDFFDLVVPYQKDYRKMVENRNPSKYSPQYNKSDVFLMSTKMFLQKLFKLIIECENKLERLRTSLLHTRSYLNAIFGNIDKMCVGFITDYDLMMFLKERGINASDEEVGLAFIRFDKNRNGKVEYYEVVDEFDNN